MAAPSSGGDVTAALRTVFEEAGVEGFVHARDIDGDGEVAFRADAPVIVASIRKIPVALTYARQAAAGALDRTARHTVTAAHREGGGIGTDSCRDDVTLSIRDLAFLMLSMSDNAATDKLMEILGTDRVRAVATELGCPRLPVGRYHELWDPVWQELGLDPDGDLDAQLEQVSEDRIRGLAMLDPTRSPAATPREITSLLTAIWRDRAGPASACAEVRALMGRQLSVHRLAAGFGDEVGVAAKNGSLWGVLNEAAVVEYPDGGRYAVAVFLRTPALGGGNPAADAAIGRAARTAVDHLRRAPAAVRTGGAVRPSGPVRTVLASVFAEAGVEGQVHVRDLDTGAEFGQGADAPVVLASVFKIPIALEYARQAAAGELDPARRHTVTAAHRAGGSGTDGCADDVEMSARDLAFMMMTISDNAASDLLLDLVGPERVRATLDGLGFPGFGFSSCAALDDDIRRELGLDPGRSLDEQLAGIPDARLLALRACAPGTSPTSTPREVTGLLAALWHDRAGPAGACAEVRDLMRQQVWQHRLVSGFPEPGVRLAGKTGTDFAVRNEAGVVEYPDGKRYAVGVFLRTSTAATRQPLADRAIGRAARAAVDHLRARS
ncbi:serine hydrolase [Streptomyces sp. NPDC047097]|uniref:serine hydrolase n=1 Tax=Streptomyces sp. NPDC047097 TaxID=3155260 RepID=UPI0033FC6412